MTNAAPSGPHLTGDGASANLSGRAEARARPAVAEWLSGRKTARDELAFLGQAAARIRSARAIAQRQAHEDQKLEPALLPAAMQWERVVACAAREAACASAQLAYIGLDIGSIAVVRRAGGDKAVKVLELLFRDGDEVRPPGLLISCLRDESVWHEWTGREREAGQFDLTEPLSPQVRPLILRLCDLVAKGYADQVRPGSASP
jgi:hypothetical protein